MTAEEWDDVIRVHLRGTFAPLRHAGAYWRARSKAGEPVDAAIINTTSSSGIYGNAGQGNYGAAKAGIAAFTVIAARELGRYGVTVNAIAPAALTRMTEGLARWQADGPQDFDPRAADNIAPLVVWLGSDQARAITGRVFNVRGGVISVAEGWRAGPAPTRAPAGTRPSSARSSPAWSRRPRPNVMPDGRTPEETDMPIDHGAIGVESAPVRPLLDLEGRAAVRGRRRRRRRRPARRAGLHHRELRRRAAAGAADVRRCCSPRSPAPAGSATSTRRCSSTPSSPSSCTARSRPRAPYARPPRSPASTTRAPARWSCRSRPRSTPRPASRCITTRGRRSSAARAASAATAARRDDWTLPDRKPDHEVTYATRPEQALIYRLSGDRNPLHSDPAFAARAGFERPILHGLCTYGVTGRALLHAMAGSDPARFASMSGRFSSPVVPGESLTVSIWADGPSALFRTTKEDGTVVIDRGRASFR